MLKGLANYLFNEGAALRRELENIWMNRRAFDRREQEINERLAELARRDSVNSIPTRGAK